MVYRSLSTLWIVLAVLLAGTIVVVLSVGPVWGARGYQQDPTAQQQTVEAAVSELFTQTADAPRLQMMTQVVGTAFANAQTATANAAVVEVVPTETLLPPQNTPEPVEPTPRPAMFPTDTIADVPVAYQEFEFGYMYWLRVNRQIWVAVADREQPTTGAWYCYEDTFQEGELETDPNLIPPEGLYQPRRGFGKLWRNTDEIRNGLGWATTPEQELLSQYRYIPGGYVENDVFYTGPGEHRLLTANSDVIAFQEEAIVGDCVGGSWRLLPLGTAG